MLGLSNNLSRPGIVAPGIVTDSLVLKHNYAAGGVVPVSDGAAFFDGTDDYISLGNDSSIQVGTGNFSFSAWVYRTDDTRSIFSYGDISDAPAWQILDNGSDKLRLRIDDDGSGAVSSVSDSTWSKNTWTHICMTFLRTTSEGLIMYINGRDADASVKDLRAQNLTLNHGSIGAYIGVRYGGALADYYKGYICNVGLWKGILTPAQVKSIMWKNYAGLTDSDKDAGATGSSNLASWWNLSANANDDHGSNNGTLS